MRVIKKKRYLIILLGSVFFLIFIMNSVVSVSSRQFQISNLQSNIQSDGQSNIQSNEQSNLPSSSSVNPYPLNLQPITVTPHNGVIDGNNTNIFYWIQISDIHINMSSEDAVLRKNFDTFCNQTVSTINPAFVISSGDNVDAANFTNPKQRSQDVNEYKFFNETLAKYGYNESFWFAGLGNHERYNTENASLFNEYMRNETQYMINFQFPFGDYRFIMLDTVQQIGLKNFFDLWGEMKSDKLNQFQQFLSDDSNDTFNQTILIGHQPINNIISERSDTGNTLSDLISQSNASVYLCGHIHQKNMYANHGYTKYDELECPNFVHRYMYRICAVDNDVFSFSDEVLNNYPAVVVTNPVDGRFYNDKMSLENQGKQSEIHALVFDPGTVNSIYAEIDGKIIGNLSYSGNNLWVIPWNSSQYQSGVHNLKIYVSSSSGNTVQQLNFNLSNFTPLPMHESLSIALLFPIIQLLSIVLVIYFIIGYSQILLPKIWRHLFKRNEEILTLREFDEKRDGFFRKHFARAWYQSANLPAYLSVPLLLVPLYNLFGPILIAPMLNNNIGIMWFSRVTILNSYVLSVYSLIWTDLYMLGFFGIVFYTIRGYKNKHNIFGRIPLLIHAGVMGVYIWVVVSYFGWLTLFINPILYLNVLIPIYFIYEVEFRKRNKQTP